MGDGDWSHTPSSMKRKTLEAVCQVRSVTQAVLWPFSVKYASVKGKKGPFCSLHPLKCPLHSGAVPQRRGVLRSLPAGCPVLRARTAGGPVAQHSGQPEGFFNVTVCQNFSPPSDTASRMFCSFHIKLTRPKFRTGYNVYVSFSHHPISVKSLEMFNLQHPSQNASNEV